MSAPGASQGLSTPRAFDAAPAIAAAIWFAGLVTALAARPLLPIDETRYLSVAWEMFRTGDWLVPHLNGLPYADKPPLLFWLITLAWSVFGVGETVARIVPALFGAGAIAATGWLARLLWPDDPALAGRGALVLAATPVFALFASLVMFDAALALFTVIGIAAMIKVWRGSPRWWLVYGVVLGLGILTKGPVMAVWLLPAALLAPLWAGAGVSWGRWYGGLALATAIGVAIALAWALPAAAAGGETYAGAILWHQTAGRIGHAFAHARPWWFYAAALPLYLYPWGWWPAAWRGWRRAIGDASGRMLVVWGASGFVIMSAISGKQLHYLLPLLPAVALLTSRSLTDGRWRETALPGLLLVGAGIAIAALPWLVGPGDGFLSYRNVPHWLAEVTPLWGLALIVATGALVAVARDLGRGRVVVVALMGLLLFLFAHAIGKRLMFARYDLTEPAAILAAREAGGLATVNKYHGEFSFLGRFERPVTVLADRPAAAAWLRCHPDGALFLAYRSRPVGLAAAPRWEYPYRRGWMGIWYGPLGTTDGRCGDADPRRRG